MDQNHAYHQLKVAPEGTLFAAFTLPLGFYELVRVSFWLLNQPVCFPRFMEHCLEGIGHEFVIPYLDDILFYSASFEDHLSHLFQVLHWLKKYDTKIRGSNPQLFKREVSYLRRLILSEKYKADAKNIAAVQEKIKWPLKSFTELRSIRGFIDWTHVFDDPFSELLKRQAENQRNKLLPWKPIHQNALDNLLNWLKPSPLLAYPGLWETIHTDATYRCIRKEFRLCVVSDTGWVIEDTWIWKYSLFRCKSQIS